MDGLRRWFNTVEALFDRSALLEPLSVSREGASDGLPLTAAQAWSLCGAAARELDPGARLKRVVAADGAIAIDGRASNWAFLFDLPRLRAKLRCEWSLLFDEAADAFNAVRIDLSVTPFPPPNSPIRQLVDQGKLLRRQMIGEWRREMARSAELPGSFRDSPEVVAEFRDRGLDPDRDEITLFAAGQPGRTPVWTAEGRDTRLETSFV